MDEFGPLPASGGSQEEAWRLQHHALRQPLNALGLFCAALKQQALSPAQLSLVDGVTEAAVSIERLVDEHFALLRGRSGDGDQAAVEAPAPVPAPERPSPSLQATPALSPGVPSALTGQTGPSAPRIVVVDDDEAARTGLVMLLEGCGAAVEPFAGIEPLACWLRQAGAAPDLLILDYHLPRPGDGLQALRLMREAWPGRPVPALLITGDERAAVSNALSDGSLECLVKPVRPVPLLTALRKQLGPRLRAPSAPQFGV